MTTLRRLRSVSDPLGSYLRVSRQDHNFLAQMLVDGRTIGSGLIADPSLAAKQAGLFELARTHGLETVLDSRALDLSTVGGFSRSGAKDLPWADADPHTPASLTGAGARRMVTELVNEVEDNAHTSVLAPTHVLSSSTDPWVRVDADLTQQLRSELNARGLDSVLIHYPLIMKSPVLYDHIHRRRFVDVLRRLPIDSVWLRVHPFGTNTSGPLALPRYIEACRDLHQLGLPIVGEHTGAVGVALLAFGAVGGIESGVTKNDHTDLSGWLTPPKPGSGGSSEARVYLHELASFIPRRRAEELFARPGMKAAHGCRNAECCKRGWQDTLANYREHFVASRASEVSSVSSVPESLRPGHYLENFLRPASDKAVRAAAIEPALEPARKRLDSWRGTLSADLAAHSAFSVSPPAAGRRRRTA